MTVEGWVLIFVFVGLVALIARPMGLYLAAVFDGRYPSELPAPGSIFISTLSAPSSVIT